MRTRGLSGLPRPVMPAGADSLDMELRDFDRSQDDLQDVGLVSPAMDELTAPSQPVNPMALRQRQLDQFRAFQQAQDIGVRNDESPAGPGHQTEGLR